MKIPIQLEDVCKTLVTERMIKYIAAKSASVIQCSPSTAPIISGRTITPPSTPITPRTSSYTCPYPAKLEAHIAQVPPLPIFISNVVERSRAQTPTLLSALVYLDRLQRRLPSTAKGMPCTCHRVFLAALILAAKYTNDSSPKNKHWAGYSSVFSLSEVNLMEKQLLFLLDYDLTIHETHLIAQIRPFFVQDIVYASPKAVNPIVPSLSVFDDYPIQAKRMQLVPEPHHYRLQTHASLPDCRQARSNSPRDHAIELHDKLQVPNSVSLRQAEHSNHASFYPSPTHSDAIDGGSRRSSISDRDTIDVPISAEEFTAYCYRNYQHAIVDGCIAVSDVPQNHAYHQPHALTDGAIC